MAEQDDKQNAGQGPSQNSDAQNGLASGGNGGMLPANAAPQPEPDVRRQLDHMSRQLDGMSKTLRRLGQGF